MRLIVFFDLPTDTVTDRREYARFRKFLVKSGFFMMQESVYCKLGLNQTVINGVLEAVRKNKPSGGVVQALTITEKQYSRMEFIVGSCGGEILNTDERFVEL